MPQIWQYLPRHLSLLTASLTTTTVPTQTPLFVNLSVTVSRDTQQTKLRAAFRFLIAEIVCKKQTNVQSPRTSVIHLLQSFWFIIDLGAAQHSCCWPPNIVQGHYDSRCWGIEVRFSSTHRLALCQPTEDSNLRPFGHKLISLIVWAL